MKMYNPVLFQDRAEAGQRLGQELKKLKIKNPLALAIPSGGVPVGVEVAKALKCPFNLIIARKIQFPWTTEAGFGAVAENGDVYLQPEAGQLSWEIIKNQTEKARKEVKQRKKEFLKNRKKAKISGKTVILVDDGLASGSTMIAAVRSLKKKNPKKIMVAVPTASAGAVQLIKPEVDELVSLYIHPKNQPFAVASSYEEWHDLTDEKVKNLLKNA